MEPFTAFWNIVALKSKQHLLAKAHYIKTLEAHFKATTPR